MGVGYFNLPRKAFCKNVKIYLLYKFNEKGMDTNMFFNKSKQGNSIEYIIIGLGNPDKKYENTRHNVGFMAVDKIASELNTDVKRIKFKSLVGECSLDFHKCLLMKPQTYMNNSGQALVQAMNFYKVPIERVIVIYDDISLEPSKLRIRRKGSDGGHNGIKSIIGLTGDDSFPRIKIGVGKKPHPEYDLADWVLSTFKSDELKQIGVALGHVKEIAEDIVNEKIDAAMNKYNT